MKIFEYIQENDTYICPNNAVLTSTGNIYNKGNHKVKHYKNFKACASCSLRAQCTTAKNGRLIERSIYQEALERNEERVNENPDYYRLRQQITEHQFGTLKRQWGFTFTLMKGKQHVLSEVNLVMICYNLRRLISIFGVNELKNRLKGLVTYFFQSYEAFLAFLSYFVLKNVFGHSDRSKNLSALNSLNPNRVTYI